ncbi:MAG TPA: hypothetical protein VNB94_01120 [Mycobacteriales bacterium]|nr:hypothetical protein [Mycobacteriales bacterium]
MSTLVAIFDGDELRSGLAPVTARDLARLGVTDVTLTSGEGGCAVVLTGWAFDGRRHEHTVVALVGGGRGARVLHGIADVVLRPDHTERPEPFSA